MAVLVGILDSYVDCMAYLVLAWGFLVPDGMVVDIAPVHIVCDEMVPGSMVPKGTVPGDVFDTVPNIVLNTVGHSPLADRSVHTLDHLEAYMEYRSCLARAVDLWVRGGH